MAETTEDPDRRALGFGAATVAYGALLAGFATIGLATQGRSIVLGLWITEWLAIALPAIIALRMANVRVAPYVGFRAPTLRQIGIAVVAGLANQPVVSLLTWAALVPAWLLHAATWAKQGEGFVLSLPGLDDYVDCGTLPIAGPVTLEAWVRPTTAPPAPRPPS